MPEWKGFDSGGTEQLWEPDVLMDMLTIFKTHEPFSRNDPNSPIFDDLENLYPNITWRNVNADGSFRPIFRKTNPLVKLKLTSEEPTDVSVLPLGDDLLSGVVNIQEVFTLAAKEYRESDGAPSMGIMCHAAISDPNAVFTLEDIEFGISKIYDPNANNLRNAINHVRNNNVVFPENSSVRKRRLRGFMNSLVRTTAISEVTGGWKLNDVNVARDIAAIVGVPAVQQITGLAHKKKTAKKTTKKKTRTARQPTYQTVGEGPRRQITVTASVESVSDPVQRALLLERANNKHEELIVSLAELIRNNGRVPIEDLNSFDIAFDDGVNQVIIEVKTITQNNCISQIRKALAQLPEYRWKHRETFGEDTKLVIVLDNDPTEFLDEEYMEYLSDDRNILVIWQQGGQFVDQENRNLSDILFPF